MTSKVDIQEIREMVRGSLQQAHTDSVKDEKSREEALRQVEAMIPLTKQLHDVRIAITAEIDKTLSELKNALEMPEDSSQRERKLLAVAAKARVLRSLIFAAQMDYPVQIVREGVKVKRNLPSSAVDYMMGMADDELRKGLG